MQNWRKFSGVAISIFVVVTSAVANGPVISRDSGDAETIHPGLELCSPYIYVTGNLGQELYLVTGYKVPDKSDRFCYLLLRADYVVDTFI